VDVVFDGERLVVAGPQTISRIVPATEHSYRCGVRFRVASAGAVIGLPAARLLDLNVEVSEVWNGDGRRLGDRLASATGPRHALERLVAGLAGRIETAGERDGVIRQAAVALVSGAPLGRVSRIVGLGERQLRRRFDDAVGFGPATLVRVQRFQRFLLLAGRECDATLARFAAEAGYADQAHLARECRRLSGMSPAALLAQGADAAGEKAVTRLGS
jgi:AraC-like DNA-binding protein